LCFKSLSWIMTGSSLWTNWMIENTV
jgi:hypothetical protein